MMQRYGYSVFCDDIRNEVGGKLSFIGCYNAVMFVEPRFPFVLSKFCAHVHLVSPASQPYRSIVVRCYAPGQEEPILEEPIAAPAPLDQMKLVAELEPAHAAPRLIVAATSLIFSPLRIEAPGLISIRAVVDGADGELGLGSLRVVPAA
jgi:hypothetical protein